MFVVRPQASNANQPGRQAGRQPANQPSAVRRPPPAVPPSAVRRHPPGLKSCDWHHEGGHAHFSLNLLKHYLALTALDSVDRWRACFAARQGISIIVWSAFGFDKGASIFKCIVRESSAVIFFSGPCVLPSELEITIGAEGEQKSSVATNWD